jgi:SAM-dependent methyltransferase/N-acetylglutamate synthase-like GNAT family acetyltransferase
MAVEVDIPVRSAVDADRAAIDSLLAAYGMEFAARRGSLVEVQALPTLVAGPEGAITGMLAYDIRGDELEVVAIYAATPGDGVGTALLARVDVLASEAGCRRIWLITTNDNVDALRFYQRRGFRLKTVYPGAVDRSRARLKPDIPAVGALDIPLHDELELERSCAPAAPAEPGPGVVRDVGAEAGADRKPGTTDHEVANREMWDGFSDEYQARHGADLAASGGAAWGTNQIPEDELHILGDVAGKHVLEFGCGAAQWSIALALRGARPVGLDFSARQLEHARTAMAVASVDFPLINASAESVPLPDASFDIVFCDHGAMTFADPYRTVPEAARLLRTGGLFAFSHGSTIETLCWATGEEHASDRLVMDYFGMHRIDDEEEITFNLPYGECIRVFRANGLVVEDLIEPRPPEGWTSSYRDAQSLAWARRWPAESIWRLRKG